MLCNSKRPHSHIQSYIIIAHNLHLTTSCCIKHNLHIFLHYVRIFKPPVVSAPISCSLLQLLTWPVLTKWQQLYYIISVSCFNLLSFVEDTKMQKNTSLSSDLIYFIHTGLKKKPQNTCSSYIKWLIIITWCSVSLCCHSAVKGKGTKMLPWVNTVVLTFAGTDYRDADPPCHRQHHSSLKPNNKYTINTHYDTWVGQRFRFMARLKKPLLTLSIHSHTSPLTIITYICT